MSYSADVYSPNAIANYFVKKARQVGDNLTPMKLLKLVYLAHGWNLALRDKSLINEPVVAWRYGPVILTVYHQFKKFGDQPITEIAPEDIDDEILAKDKITTSLLDRIWEVYGGYTAIQLSNLTHEKGSPWDQAWNQQDGKSLNNYCINNNTIQDYYAGQLKV